MSPFDELLAQDQKTDNPFDATVAEIIGSEDKTRRQQLLEVQQSTRDIDPARQAKAIGIAREKGVPVDIVRDSLQQFDEQAGPDFDALLKEAPATAELLADPIKGPVAFGDHKPLAAIEGAVRNLGKAEYLETTPRTTGSAPDVAKPYTPLVEQVLGKGAGMLSPEQAAIEQQKMIAERAGAVQIADERARQAQLAVEAERKFREENDPAYAYGGANRLQTLTEQEAARKQTASRKSLVTAREQAPTQAPWRNTTDRIINSVISAPGLAVQGVGALGDALEYLMPTGTGDLDEEGRSWLTRAGEEMLKRAEELAPADKAREQEFWGSQVPQAVGSMVSFLAAGWAAKAAGLAPGWGAGILGTATGAGQGAQDAASSGATIGQRHAQTIVSAIFGATEALPVETIFSWMEQAGGRSFTRFMGSVVSSALTEGAQEGAQTFGPDLLAKLTYDPSRDVVGNTITAAGAALVTGGFFGALGSLARTRSARDQQLLTDIGQAVNETKTSQIAPEILEEHLANLKARGAAPEQVTAPAEAVATLFQEMAPDDARSAFPEIVQAMEEAQATGAEVTIPTEKLAALAKLKGYDAFTEHVRVRPDDLTPAEAKGLQGEVDQLLKDYDTRSRVPDPEQTPVFQSVRDQLVAAGQAPEVARTNALLHAAFFATQSERTGVPVADLMRRYGFEVSSSVVTAQEIGPQLDALRRGETPNPEVQSLLAAAGLTRNDVLELTNEQVVERVAQQTLAQETPRGDSQDAQGVDLAPGGMEGVTSTETPPADSAEASGTALRQDAKGFITFSPARDRFKVTLTGKADLSTFLHESGHFFLEVLQDSVARGEASPRQVADLDALRTWMGAEQGKPLSVKNHEQFARGFEAYLMEGKAPSYALQQAFTRFKAWLIFVYRRLSGLNVQLTDDVRNVMDRLVASDAAIEEARVRVGWGGKPMPQEYTGLTDGEYKAYVEAWLKAADAQSMDADARVMLEAGRELKRTWRDEKIRITKEVEAEVAAQPGYQAWKGIEEREMRIQADLVPADLRGMARGLTSERGLDPDTMAEIFGFDSGEEMLKAIAAARLAQRAIPATVRQRMMATHGEMDAQSLAHEAAKAVHNKPTADVLLTEFRALAEKANLKVARNTMAVIRAQAEEKVAGLTRRQLDPAKWRRAELKAATEAATFAAKGKATEAALAKRRQLMAAAMARATLEARDRIETIRDYLATFTTNRRRAQLGKAGDMYLDGIDQILEAIEFKEVPLKLLKKRPALQEIVDAAIAADEPIAIPPEILGAGLRNYSQMTLAELEAVNDAVINLWTLAKLKNTLKTRQGKIQLDKAMEQAAANAEANLGKVRQTDTLNPGVVDRATSSLRWVRAQLVKMEFLFGWLDGKPEGGLLHSLIYQPIADARAAEYRMMKEMSGLILDRIRSLPRDQRVRWDTKRQFMGQTMKGANIIAVALNLGNEQNKAKLLKGYGWNEAQLMAELNAFMTKADWDMVQHIWTSIDKLWPHIERVAKNATGLAPPRVIPSAVQTPFGEYAGGYYPIVYDPNQTQRQAENQERNAAANGLFSNNFLRPSLENGFTKKRTNYAAPILLSLDVLSTHLAETIHYVTHYEAVKQADKIRSHPTFQKLVSKSMGKEFWREIRPWLQDIANNVTQRRYPELGEVAMRRLRIGTSVAAMGFNIGTGIKQLFGVVTALDAIGPRYWASGIRKSWLSPRVAENWRFAMKESQELEPLIRDFDRDVKQINDAYATKISGGIREGLVRHAFTHIGYMQLVVNVATWHGAYEQALARGESHEKAVIAADGVVRKTQSSGSVKDLANVQRSGEATKLLTMFYSYMSIVYNRLEDIAKQQKGLRDIPRTASRLTIMAILPALLNVAYDVGYKSLFGDDDDGDDEQSFFTRVALESASQITGSVPILRSVIDPRGYGASVSPVVGKVEQLNRAAASLKDWLVEGEAPSRKELRTISDAVAVTTMLPVSSIYKLIDDMVGDRLFDN